MTSVNKQMFLVADSAEAVQAESGQRRLNFAAESERLAKGGSAAHEGQVIAVARSRGGIGATMLAVNLAHQLATIGSTRKSGPARRVALVDLDLQFGMVAGFLDLEPSPALYDMARDGGIPDDTFLDQSLQSTPDGLDVLCAPSAFAPLDALRPDQLRGLIEALQARYDYVVVDLPHALVDWVSPVLAHAGLMYLVTDLSVPSLQQARRLIDAYAEDNLALEIEIVVNHEARPLLPHRHHQEAARALERELRHWLPDDRRAAKEAADRGLPLGRVARHSSLAKAVGKLAQDRLKKAAAAAHVS